jgi:hypothetical protein
MSSVKLNPTQKRIVNEHQVYHIMCSFLTVSETGEKALPALYSATKSTFAAYVASDKELNEDMRDAALLGNRNAALTGLKLWTRAKDYKRNFINKYQPLKNNEPTPSGFSNDDDIIDLVRKKFWLKKEIEAAKATDVDPPTSFEACPPTFQPVDFFAYTKLHDHVKLQIVASNKRNNSDPEFATNEFTVRSQTPSRKQQRKIDKVSMEPNGTSPSTTKAIGNIGGATGMQAIMESKLEATQFTQRFELAKFCVQQGFEGGNEIIKDMMEDEQKKIANKKKRC